MGSRGDALPPPSAPQTDPVLRRSSRDQMIAGVCGGLGRYFGIDPVIVRIVFVALALLGGSGVLAYVLAWIIIPRERSDEGTAGGADQPTPGRADFSGSAVFGAVLVVLGGVLLADQLIPGVRTVLGPLILIALGVLILMKVRR